MAGEIAVWVVIVALGAIAVWPVIAEFQAKRRRGDQ